MLRGYLLARKCLQVGDNRANDLGWEYRIDLVRQVCRYSLFPESIGNGGHRDFAVSLHRPCW